MISEDFIQAINEHVMGDCSEFTALKKRFKDFNTCADQPAAAALGYLVAKAELEAAKEEEKPDVYDEVVEVLKTFLGTRVSTHTTADHIFTLIYEWLDDELVERGYANYPSYTRDCIKLLFQSFVIKKPEA
ncbi:hypothetical protein UFOVP649_39 [uncultured Caudovirales phage]|uniref:Uncharacterized protein n=1 Tax=uncultured Caudovirales phage TaxID=2100421 RepID=A0A6J5N5V9_9CAUD|nr:hypothetical protein UFOVP649_39 [uncultured Caudovirales phage]